jgi:PAS domain S-box-containing protein
MSAEPSPPAPGLLGELTNAVAAATAGDFSVRLADVARFGPLGPLAGELNGLLESLSRHATLRERWEAALRGAEELTSLAPTAVNQGLYDLDMQTGEAVVSPEYATMLGYDPAHFKASTTYWLQRIHPDDRARVEAVFNEYLAGTRDTHSLEYRYRTHGGDWKWLLSLGKLVARDAGGRPLRMVGTHTDISDRKAAEEALRESEYFLRRSQEVARLGSYRLDVNAGTWMSSPMLDEVFGIDAAYPRNVEGWTALVFPDDREMMGTYFARDVIERRGRFDKKYRIVRQRDRQIRWVHGLGELEIDQAGGVVTMIGTIQDITERKQFEDALRVKDTAIAMSIDAIGMADAEGRLTYVNPSLLRLWGYDHERELIGQPLPVLTRTPEDGAALLEALRTAGRWHGEIPARTRDGSPFDALLSANVVSDDRGKPIQIMVSFVDITEQKRSQEQRAALEAQLSHAQRMESVGRLAGGVAHDFNNMLTVILGYSELIRNSLPPDHPLLADVEQIERAAAHSRDITRQLLAFSRKQIIAPRVVDLNELVEASARTLSRLIGEDIELRFLPASDAGIVELDPTQIEQMLMNMAVNSRDAMPRGGHLTIETTHVDIDEDYCRTHLEGTPGRYVVLTVSDDGIGMDRATLERIFDPFFTTKEIGKGTGLGLATVYGIVKQNRGFITAYSEPGRGTTFRIYIPALGEVAEPARRREPIHPAPVGARVLLVEDDEMVRRMTAQMLETLGHKVVVVPTPFDALLRLEEPGARFDLLLTDVVMPGMSGPELGDQARAIRPDLKVLYTSGYTTDVIVHHGVLDRGVHFIQKPFSRGNLALAIERVMQAR